jgi:hypothetical protein
MARAVEPFLRRDQDELVVPAIPFDFVDFDVKLADKPQKFTAPASRNPIAAVAGQNGSWYPGAMKLAEIEQEALALPERERASLAARLLDTLPPPGTDVSDEEVVRRERELESGQVAAKFVRRVRQERGR